MLSGRTLHPRGVPHNSAIIQKQTRFCLFARKKGGALPTARKTKTEEAGEPFNPDLQSYKTGDFVSRTKYAPIGAALIAKPANRCRASAILIRRLATTGSLSICRLSANEPPNEGTAHRTASASARGKPCFRPLVAKSNARHTAHHPRYSAEPLNVNPRAGECPRKPA